MMALMMTIGAMAQFQQISPVQNRDDVFAAARHHKAPTATYNNGAKTANATIAIVSNDGLTVTATVTPNADCLNYIACVLETGLLEAIVDYYGYTPAYVISVLGEPYTGTQTVTLTGATPNNVSNTVYVAAIGTADTAIVSSVYTSNYIGGTGTANVVLDVPTVNTTSADVTATINDQTSYYYISVYSTSSITEAGATTDDVRAVMEQNDDRTYESGAWTYGTEDSPLTNNTEYTVYAFAYNQNEVLGTYTAPIHFITGQGVVNGLNDVETVSSSVYPNPAKDNVNIAAKAKIERVEMFNMMGQKVSEKSVNSMFTSVNVANLNAGTYVVKVYTNAGVATKKIVVE